MGAAPQNKKLQRNAYRSEDEGPRADKAVDACELSLDCFLCSILVSLDE